MWRWVVLAGMTMVGCSQNYSDQRAEPALAKREMKPLGGDRLTLGALTVALPPDWQSVPPANSMRLAEFLLPGKGGDASLAVFHFGVNQGGTVQSNIDRWVGQFTRSDGSPIGSQARIGELETGAGRATMVDVSGIYSGGMGGEGRQQDWRMLGAIVEASQGLYFFKAIGPAVTLEDWAATFEDFIDSVREGS